MEEPRCLILDRKLWQLPQRERRSQQQALKVWKPWSLPTWSDESHSGLLMHHLLEKPRNASRRRKAVGIFASELEHECIHCYCLWIWFPRDIPGQKMIVPAGKQIHSVRTPELFDPLKS